MDGLRVPARIAVLVLLSLCVLAAIGISRLLANLRRPRRVAAVAILAAAMFAEGWAAPLHMAPFDHRGRSGDRSGYRWLAQQPPGGVVELPILEWSIAPTLTFQYATLTHGHPIVNGYSGYGSTLQEFLGGAGITVQRSRRDRRRARRAARGRRPLHRRAPARLRRSRASAPRSPRPSVRTATSRRKPFAPTMSSRSRCVAWKVHRPKRRGGLRAD